MSDQEQKFIMISMKFMFEEQIDFGKFFHNNYEDRRFLTNVRNNRFCNLVEMHELPEYSHDRAVIRILQHRKWPLMDVNDSERFLRLKFAEHSDHGHKHDHEDEKDSVIKR